jgi:hypothetical protein
VAEVDRECRESEEDEQEERRPYEDEPALVSSGAPRASPILCLPALDAHARPVPS